MNNIIERTWNRNSMVTIEDLRGMAFQDEENAHTFRIRGVNDNGEPVALSGTVSANFLRGDNTDVQVTGSITDGAAVVTLPAACYEIQGRFRFTIFLTSSGQKVAIYAAMGSVQGTTSN